MYELICTDADGTLLNSKREISEKSIRTIQKAYKKGVKIVVCTGRLFTSANYFSEILGVYNPVIASNGAYIKEREREKVIYKEPLGEENCKKVLAVCLKHGLEPRFNTHNCIYTTKVVYENANYIRYNKTVPDIGKVNVKIVTDWENIIKDHCHEIFKCAAVDADYEKIRMAKMELSHIDTLEVVSSSRRNIEVMNKGVSKGKAVEILANYYNIPREKIICIGNNENDMSMLLYAGLGVAVGNAEEDLKKAADYIAPTNDENGVASVIERFIL